MPRLFSLMVEIRVNASVIGREAAVFLSIAVAWRWSRLGLLSQKRRTARLLGEARSVPLSARTANLVMANLGPTLLVFDMGMVIFELVLNVFEKVVLGAVLVMSLAS